MAKCVSCGAETQLFAAGVPVCLKCVEARDKDEQKPKPATTEPAKPVQGKRA